MGSQPDLHPDIYAPGLLIKSAWNAGDHYNNTLSHTPMAAAHMAGAAAMIRGLDSTSTDSALLLPR